MYFDETGNGDLGAAAKTPNERYLSLTGVVVRQDHHDGYLTRRMNLLKENIFGDPGIIFHRRDIMRREGDFSLLNNIERGKEFDARFSAIVAECIAVAFTVSIDKLAHKEKYTVWRVSPYHYLLECLLERFVLWLKKSKYQGDMVGEARNATHDARLKRAFQHYYNHKTGQLVNATLIQKHLTSNKLRLEPKTKNIAGLQIADSLAHPCHRSLKFEQFGETLQPDHGTYLVSLLNQYSYDRHPKNGIKNYGTKWLP
ncbi:MAG: DUF3800 domain-containing protein [Sphingorhabdus sp.]